MYLTEEERFMVSGGMGAGVAKCMDLLVKIGEAFGAKRFIPIRSAHVMPKEPPKLLEELTEGAEKLEVPICTQHSLMSAFDPEWAEVMDLPLDFVLKEKEETEQRRKIYKRLGFYQTNTCLPMLVGNVPLKGQHVSWIGSGAQLMVNSLLGARTNRDGVVVNLAAAITGRVPEMGLHLEENRRAKVLVRLDDDLDTPSLSDIELGAIGYYVGGRAGNRNVVFDGIPDCLTFEQLKYLMTPLSVSGAVSICHIVGVTPEASTLEEALGGAAPEETVVVKRSDIQNVLRFFSVGSEEMRNVDLVVLGCPHCTLEEIKLISSLLDGNRILPGKRLWIGFPSPLRELAKKMGYIEPIERAGGVIASACMATIPDHPLPDGVSIVATNSLKAAHYIRVLTKEKIRTLVLSAEDCIEMLIGVL